MGKTVFLPLLIVLVMVMRPHLKNAHSEEEPVFRVLMSEQVLLLSVVAKVRYIGFVRSTYMLQMVIHNFFGTDSLSSYCL